MLVGFAGCFLLDQCNFSVS